MKHLLIAIAVLCVAFSLSAATPDLIFASGKQALLANDADKAAESFEQLVKIKPDSAEYHFWLGRAYGAQASKASMFSAPGLASKTRTEFERAVELDPNYNDARFALIEYYMQAPGFMGGSEEKALQQAAEVKKRDALQGHRAFGIVYMRQKKPDLARKEYYDAVREQPNSPRAHQSLGIFLMGEKNYKQAAEEYETAVKLDPAFMPGWFQIGHVAALAETNYPHGEEALRKYLAYTPNDKDGDPPLARAWFWLGRIYENQGHKAEAKQMYTTSLKLTPGAKDVTEALKRVS
jgi:tetratricopeptide (TPR) repeat protein